MSEETAIQPVHERLRRWRRLDDLEGLRRRVHRACRAAEEILYSEEASIDQRLKAVHAITAASREHKKLIEAAELEERVAVLEELVTTNGRRG